MSLNNNNLEKPHVLYIRQKKTETQVFAQFEHKLEDEFTFALEKHCYVTVIDCDFDYGEICDMINPDLVLIETPGGYRPNPIKITNKKARSDIPKIGLFIQDPHDSSRPAFLKLLNEMEVENYFVLGTTSIRQSPELSKSCFSIPLFFDTTIFKDYYLEKHIPITIFGGTIVPEFYKWRATQAPSLISHFPTLVYTHPGYSHPIPSYRYHIQGEAYAKMLNRSYFSISDTTRLDYLVRKHLEIPACGAVLIAPSSDELTLYGFIDMHNCILGEGNELLNKIATVASSPELYETIRQNGYHHVHQNFSHEKWRYIVDWYECAKKRKPGEIIQQEMVFGKFHCKVKEKNMPAIAQRNSFDSEFTIKMSFAKKAIIENKELKKAAQYMLEIIAWDVAHISEPWLLLGIIAMLEGKTSDAKTSLLKPFHVRVKREGNSILDPEETAWLYLLATLTSDSELLKFIDSTLRNTKHISIRRMIWFLQKNDISLENISPAILESENDDQLSIHWMGNLPLTDWMKIISTVCLVCNNSSNLQSNSIAPE